MGGQGVAVQRGRRLCHAQLRPVLCAPATRHTLLLAVRLCRHARVGVTCSLDLGSPQEGTNGISYCSARKQRPRPALK